MKILMLTTLTPRHPSHPHLTEHPLVSAIVPAYNAQRTISATLQSLVGQSYPHLEIIVTDDGSSDQTVQLVCQWMRNDSLIRKHCFERAGLYNTPLFAMNAQGCEDFDMFLRISEHFEFKLVRAYLTGYRKAGSGMSSLHRKMERSKLLVYQDQKARHPWIPDIDILMEGDAPRGYGLFVVAALSVAAVWIGLRVFRNQSYRFLDAL